MNKKLPSLHIGDLKVDPPIIQGGMGVRVSRSNLAAAVANEGCVGVIAGVGLGKFRYLYPRYLPAEYDGVSSSGYAHNDWLEAGTETGFPGLVLFYAISKTIGLRVTPEEERKGLDIGEHGMEAYAGFQIFSTM